MILYCENAGDAAVLTSARELEPGIDTEVVPELHAEVEAEEETELETEVATENAVAPTPMPFSMRNAGR